MFKYEDLVAFIKASRETADDQTALNAKELYPSFEKIKGTYQHKGARCTYEVGGELFLYKLICEDQTAEGTLIVENWTPTTAASIWSAIDETHTGTLEDPIPAVRSMEYIYGKYYFDEGKIYLCKRTGEPDGKVIRLDYLPSELVGQYFEIVQ